jgi:hypothetical protein
MYSLTDNDHLDYLMVGWTGAIHYAWHRLLCFYSEIRTKILIMKLSISNKKIRKEYRLKNWKKESIEIRVFLFFTESKKGLDIQ